MLATILKSPVAIQATLSIIETFSKIRELSRSVKELSSIQDKTQQKALMQRSGELIAEIFDEDLQTSDTETTTELRCLEVYIRKHPVLWQYNVRTPRAGKGVRQCMQSV